MSFFLLTPRPLRDRRVGYAPMRALLWRMLLQGPREKEKGCELPVTMVRMWEDPESEAEAHGEHLFVDTLYRREIKHYEVSPH